MTAPALRIAMLVGNLTDAIADVQEAVGIEDTRKLLMGLAESLGAPERHSAPEGVGAPSGTQPAGGQRADRRRR